LIAPMKTPLPDDVQYADRQPDGSDVLIFGEKTAWVLSHCDTCARPSLIEILRKEGQVIGIRFVPGDQEKLPDGALETLEADRQKRSDAFDHTWDAAEEAS